jgi:hypothetical protein
MPERPQALTNHAAATHLRTLMTQLTHEKLTPATQVATRPTPTQKECRLSFHRHLASHRHRHHDDRPEAA